jgi:serine/threonine protein kinase
MTEDEVAYWTWQICSAISALHQKGICHRDIKPDNFMVQSDPSGRGKLKLADFGLAIFIPHGKHGRLTWKCGTPAFWSPEIRNLPNRSPGYSFGVDVFAAGCSMFMVMFGGRHPFLTSSGQLRDRCVIEESDFLMQEDGIRSFSGKPRQHRFSSFCQRLCENMLQPSEKLRIRAGDCLKDQWFERFKIPALLGRNNGQQLESSQGSKLSSPAESRQGSKQSSAAGDNLANGYRYEVCKEDPIDRWFGALLAEFPPNTAASLCVKRHRRGEYEVLGHPITVALQPLQAGGLEAYVVSGRGQSEPLFSCLRRAAEAAAAAARDRAGSSTANAFGRRKTAPDIYQAVPSPYGYPAPGASLGRFDSAPSFYDYVR